MFNRRTLAAFTAVAALAGGASGAVTSTITTPEGANAADVPVSQTNPKLLRGQDPVKMALLRINTRVVAIDTRTAAMERRLAAMDSRTAETKEMIDSLAGMTARGTSGRSLVNLVDDILAKSRLICADVVGEVVPIAPDRHVAACD